MSMNDIKVVCGISIPFTNENALQRVKAAFNSNSCGLIDEYGEAPIMENLLAASSKALKKSGAIDGSIVVAKRDEMPIVINIRNDMYKNAQAIHVRVTIEFKKSELDFLNGIYDELKKEALSCALDGVFNIGAGECEIKKSHRSGGSHLYIAREDWRDSLKGKYTPTDTIEKLIFKIWSDGSIGYELQVPGRMDLQRAWFGRETEYRRDMMFKWAPEKTLNYDVFPVFPIQGLLEKDTKLISMIQNANWYALSDTGAVQPSAYGEKGSFCCVDSLSEAIENYFGSEEVERSIDPYIPDWRDQFLSGLRRSYQWLNEPNEPGILVWPLCKIEEIMRVFEQCD